MTTTVVLPGNWHGSVELGVLDARAEACFTKGQCHSFALALSEATGWPVYGVGQDNWGECEFNHFVVLDPNTGDLVDIKGRHSVQDIIDAYGRGPGENSVDIDDVEYWVGQEELYELHIEEASTFVEPLLSKIAAHRKVA